jgi:2,3-bisphosphoglycerate-independent phosphoglycerate mutase
VYLVILCGAGDRPIAALGGRTPLEIAPTPELDALARAGSIGRLRVIDESIPPESDSGAMALLGYDPLVHYTGRGPLEALGAGFWPAAGSAVAFRINLASLDPASGRLDRRTARDLADDELQQLAAEIRERVRLERCPSVRYELTAFGRHRGILCLTSEAVALGGAVSNTDPGFRRAGVFGVPIARHAPQPADCVPLDGSAGAAATAEAVNEFVRESARVLASSAVNRRRRAAGRLPANVVLLRDAGDALPELNGFRDRTGHTVALYGQVPAERGLCMLVDGRFVPSAPRAGQPAEDFHRELAPAVADDPASLVLIHLKGADEPSHDGRPLEKAAALAGIDSSFIGPLRRLLGTGDLLVVTGDHATPCELGIHAADPVPTLAYGPGIPADRAERFTEREAAAGALPVSHATALVSYLAGAAVT